LNSFLINVTKIKENIGKGKIIMNCRDSYINDNLNSNPDSSITLLNEIEVFELLPFNAKLAEDFFSLHFERDQKITKAMNLLNEFVIDSSNNSYIYLPFVLEIVKQFIDKEFDEKIQDFTFNSKLLTEKDITDSIIFKTCFRETSKKERNGFDLPVDKQVKFMIYLSIEKRGFINENEFIDVLKNINLSDRLSDYANGLKDHPFLIKSDNKYFLRFDFLGSYFKSLEIFNLIKHNSVIKPSILTLLASDCNYNSHITKYLIQKIKGSPNEFLKNFKMLIDNIQNLEAINEIKQKAICNLFQIIQQSFPSTSPQTNKNIIQQLFNLNGDIKTINNFYLLDISDSSKLVIDFSDLFFMNTIIKNYANFFNCTFDQNTLFDETCFIAEVTSNVVDYDNITADINNFDSTIRGDNSIIKVLNMKKSDDGLGLRRFVISSLKLFFKCFYDGQNMIFEKPQKDIIINYKLLNGPASIDKVFKVLTDNKIIEINDNSILIQKKYRNKIDKFVEGGLNFDFLNQAMISLNENSL
jgi:hypothetical protein